jgi:hypothetical protein
MRFRAFLSLLFLLCFPLTPLFTVSITLHSPQTLSSTPTLTTAFFRSSLFSPLFHLFHPVPLSLSRSQCEASYHASCLNIPIPSDPEWFCANCEVSSLTPAAGQKQRKSRAGAAGTKRKAAAAVEQGEDDDEGGDGEEEETEAPAKARGGELSLFNLFCEKGRNGDTKPMLTFLDACFRCSFEEEEVVASTRVFCDIVVVSLGQGRRVDAETILMRLLSHFTTVKNRSERYTKDSDLQHARWRKSRGTKEQREAKGWNRWRRMR